MTVYRDPPELPPSHGKKPKSATLAFVTNKSTHSLISGSLKRGVRSENVTRDPSET